MLKRRKFIFFAVVALAAMALIAGPLAIHAAAGDYVIYAKGHVTGPPVLNSTKSLIIGVGSQINGDVGSQGDVWFNGAVELSGTVDTNSQFAHGNGVKVGTPPALAVPPSSNNYAPGAVNENLIPPVVQTGLPVPAALFPGIIPNPLPPGNNKSAVFAPNTPLTAYQAITGGGGATLTFPIAGDYYFDSFGLANGTTLEMDLNGGPIRIFVRGRANFGGGTEVVTINGSTYNHFVPNIYLEAQHAGTAAQPYAFDSDGGSHWLGDVFCPYGGINFGSGGGGNTFDGHFWSDWDGSIGGGHYVAAVYIEHGVRNPDGDNEGAGFLECLKYISVDGKDPSDPTKTWLINDVPPGEFVPFGTPIYFKFSITNPTIFPVLGATLTDSFFGTPAAPTPPYPLWDPNPPDPFPGKATPASPPVTYEYIYGPITFQTLFPCVGDQLLVWGRGTQTTSALWKSAVHIGQGSDVQGNVGAIGDVDINGTGWIHGDLTTQSQFIGISCRRMSPEPSTCPACPRRPCFRHRSSSRRSTPRAWRWATTAASRRSPAAPTGRSPAAAAARSTSPPAPTTSTRSRSPTGASSTSTSRADR